MRKMISAVVILLTGCCVVPANAAPAAISEIDSGSQSDVSLVGWGGGHGRSEGSGYGGRQPDAEEEEYIPPKRKKPKYEEEDYAPPKKKNNWEDGGGYGGKPSGGNQPDDEEEAAGGPEEEDEPSPKPAGDKADGGDRAQCIAQCKGKCEVDFVPGSDKHKQCSNRCARTCRFK